MTNAIKLKRMLSSDFSRAPTTAARNPKLASLPATLPSANPAATSTTAPLSGFQPDGTLSLPKRGLPTAAATPTTIPQPTDPTAPRLPITLPGK